MKSCCLGASTLLSFLTSYLWPENYDFEVTRAIDRQERCEPGTSKGSNDVSSVDMYQDVKKSDSVTSVKQTGDIDIPALRKSYRIAVGASLTLFLVLIILVRTAPLLIFNYSWVRKLTMHFTLNIYIYNNLRYLCPCSSLLTSIHKPDSPFGSSLDFCGFLVVRLQWCLDLYGKVVNF